MLETTPRKGSSARERILEVAEAAVLEKGFAATSIDELIAAAGITKSGFFYHFKDKGELATALMERYMRTTTPSSPTSSAARTNSTRTRCTAFWWR